MRKSVASCLHVSVVWSCGPGSLLRTKNHGEDHGLQDRYIGVRFYFHVLVDLFNLGYEPHGVLLDLAASILERFLRPCMTL